MGSRRSFINRAGKFSAIALLSSLAKPAWARNLEKALREAEGISAADIAGEEDFGITSNNRLRHLRHHQFQ